MCYTKMYSQTNTKQNNNFTLLLKYKIFNDSLKTFEIIRKMKELKKLVIEQFCSRILIFSIKIDI